MEYQLWVKAAPPFGGQWAMSKFFKTAEEAWSYFHSVPVWNGTEFPFSARVVAVQIEPHP